MVEHASKDKSLQKDQFQIQVQKIYTKSVSYEIAQGQHIINIEWEPELSVAFDTQVNTLPEDKTFEVTLVVKVKVRCPKSEIFKIKLQEAGIFVTSDIDSQHLDQVKYAFCPNILYPYAREIVSDIVSKGGFPQLCLGPVNFDILYEQKKRDIE
jgi:preprotein translocase subunit SecB